jgi:hypothetical protein
MPGARRSGPRLAGGCGAAAERAQAAWQRGLVFGIPGAIRHYLAGRQFSVADEYGIPYGTVRVNYQHLDRARWSKTRYQGSR